MLDALSHDMIGRALVLGYTFLVGLCLGSFASAIADRTQKKISWIKGESRGAARSCCPDCHHQLVWFDLVPLFSWLFLRGRCRYCSRPIGKLYPFIELIGGATMLIFAVVITNSFLLLPMALGLPFVLAAFLMSIQKNKAPQYMLFILCGTYVATLFYVPANQWGAIIVIFSAVSVLCVMYIKPKYRYLNLAQGIFFSIWANLIVTFCQMFTLRL